MLSLNNSLDGYEQICANYIGLSLYFSKKYFRQLYGSVFLYCDSYDNNSKQPNIFINDIPFKIDCNFLLSLV